MIDEKEIDQIIRIREILEILNIDDKDTIDQLEYMIVDRPSISDQMIVDILKSMNGI